jgi:hypothetical protein
VTCLMCGNTLYVEVSTGDWRCARCCPPREGDVLVLASLLED